MDSFCPPCNAGWYNSNFRFCGFCGRPLFIRLIPNIAQPGALAPLSNDDIQQLEVAGGNATLLDGNQTIVLPENARTADDDVTNQENTTRQGSPMDGVENDKLPAPAEPRQVKMSASIPVHDSLTVEHGASPDIKIEDEESESTASRARDARSRSPPLSRGHGAEELRDYRERQPLAAIQNGADDQRNRNEQVGRNGPKSAYRGSVPWSLYLRAYRLEHGSTALPILDSFWEYFHLGNGTNGGRHPTTMLHIKDITHNLVAHFNRFGPFMTERNEFVEEVSLYLVDRLSEPTYQAWVLRNAECGNACLRYLEGLMEFVHNLQWFLIRKPLLGPEVDQKAYQTSLRVLNKLRDEYTTPYKAAWQNMRQSMDTHDEESRQTTKIREGFLCLCGAMPNPSNKPFLRYISPEDFPLPAVHLIKRRWESYPERLV